MKHHACIHQRRRINRLSAGRGRAFFSSSSFFPQHTKKGNAAAVRRLEPVFFLGRTQRTDFERCEVIPFPKFSRRFLGGFSTFRSPPQRNGQKMIFEGTLILGRALKELLGGSILRSNVLRQFGSYCIRRYLSPLVSPSPVASKGILK